MQYVRSISGSVSKTWNSINPATLSGAIDVIVIEQDDGSLACSPFHVRFGKFSLLRPFEKKVEFRVNDVKQDFPMKLGEGGEAFFVFETSSQVPEALQTSPLVSPTVTPNTRPSSSSSSALVQEPEPLDLNSGGVLDGSRPIPPRSSPMSLGDAAGRGGRPSIPSLMLSHSLPYEPVALDGQPSLARAASVGLGETPGLSSTQSSPKLTGSSLDAFSDSSKRPASPPALPRDKAVHRAMTLSKKLLSSNIPSHVNDEGDLMLDMTGFKSSEEDALRAEHIARQILAEEVVGNYDIGGLIGADEKGNLWIYSSEEAKEMAAKRTAYNPIDPRALVSTDALSDPGYQSDDTRSQKSPDLGPRHDRQGSDSAIILNSAPESPVTPGNEQEPARNFAKTLRLTSDQLKTLNLQSGLNTMCFTVNRATCQANIYLWSNKTPIVVSDIDGTITKSDALGHVLNMIGRDWTHVGVAKLYTDIINNGYNIFYLTSRSVGQADTTRAYLSGIVQEGYKLPRGPVIMSPDRTIAALRREVYLRKPEVFKMACLRDIMGLFDSNRVRPFYAGFGNRLTDALSYRSVNIPSTRIFTINSNAEVSLDLLSLSKYKTAYTSMRETVDQYFPPVALLLEEGGDAYTDFNTWRDTPLEIDDISDSEDPMTEDEDMSGDEDEDDDDVFSEDLEQSSILGRESLEESIGNIRESIESDSRPGITRLGSESMTVPGRYRNAGRKQPAASKDDVSDEEEQDLEASVESLDLIAAAAGPQARYTLAEQQRRRGKAGEQSLRRAGDEVNAAARLRESTR